MLHSNRKKGTTVTWNSMDESQKPYIELNKPNTKRYLLYYYIYMKF